ncbi:MAG TPA: glycosyltransferase [Phnomibacter sp.]|nr:glycosyltransferase [Phnomibacter sp.]
MPNTQSGPLVLWLASWYPCRIDPFNGDFIQRSARAFATLYPVHVLYIMKDHEGKVTRWHLEETEMTGQLTETRIYYHPPQSGIKPLDRLISAMMYTRLGRKWLKDLRNGPKNKRPWIVEVGVAMRAGTLALWMKRKWGQRYLVQEHWTGYYRHLMPPPLQRGPLFWKMTHRILANTDLLIPDSRHLGEWINETMLPVKYREIPNTVDTNVFFYRPVPAKGDDHFRFIHVSTLGYHKNTEGIIRTFRELLKMIPRNKPELLVVGPDPGQHLKFVENDPVLKGQVLFTGSQTYGQVATHMRTSDALVLFSRFENLPCVMLEAFCCGLPVIATRVGGIPYHLPPCNGMLVDSEKEDQLLEAMIRMISGFRTFNREKIASTAAARYGTLPIARAYLETYADIYPQIMKKPDILTP